ncbi:MAG: hypothetical protein ABIX37_09985 [Gammaproteobacteria bacterium]
MSRSALVVAGALFALGIAAWLLIARRDAPEPGPANPRVMAAPPPATVPAALPSMAPAGKPPAPDNAPPRITNRDEFVAALAASGRNGEKLLEAYQEWRVSRGYLGPDPLTGVTAENAPAAVYAAMDRTTLKSLADSGDLGAIQAYAVNVLPEDADTAVKYFGRASRLGSAAAMVEIATVLAGMDGPAAGRQQQDAAAWLLAAIRRHGPMVGTPDGLEQIERRTRLSDPAFLDAACASSLAILADLTAATAGRDSGALPPAFLAEKDLYDRLPCRDTPAPVTPPRALQQCTASPAMGSGNRPIELWICGEN